MGRREMEMEEWKFVETQRDKTGIETALKDKQLGTGKKGPISRSFHFATSVIEM